MPVLLDSPTVVDAAGTLPKEIAEYVGRASTGEMGVSIAHMRSPAGWSEPSQTPEFDEWSLVVAGVLVVEHEGGTIEVAKGAAVFVPAGETVRYRTPEGAEYVAICRPAFAPDLVHRSDDG